MQLICQSLDVVVSSSVFLPIRVRRPARLSVPAWRRPINDDVECSLKRIRLNPQAFFQRRVL